MDADHTKGDCFIVAAGIVTRDQPVGHEFIDESRDAKWWLVHGVVRGAAGVVADRYYWHAWVEVEVQFPTESNGNYPLTFVIDKSSGQDVITPKEFYYQRGEPRHIFRYSVDQTRQFLTERRHFGPWIKNYTELCDI